MDDLEELSVLDYARSKGIATEHLTLDPSDLLGQIRDSELVCATSVREDLTQGLSGHEPPIARNDKLELDKDGARFLSSVLKDVSSLQADARYIPEEFCSFAFPKYNPRHDMKVDVPLLTFEEERAMQTFGQGHDPIALLDEVVPVLAHREEASLDEGLEFPDYFWELPSMFDRDPNTDKLNASRDTARFLQLAVGYLDEKRHKEELEKLYTNSDLATMLSRRRPTSPLYIEPEDLDEHHHSSEGGTDVNWSPDTEMVLGSQKDSLTSCETTAGGDHTRDNEPQSMTRRCTSPKQVGRIEESTVEEVLENTYRKLDIVNSPTDSPLTMEKAKSKRPNKPSRTMDFPAPLSGSLSTLSAFMQTRPQRNKRRRLGNESRCFSDQQPGGSSKAPEATDESSTSKQPEETVKLSSPPLHTQDTQNHYLYPWSTESTAAPLTLILSTHLLRTESALVRSLENISGSQSIRLIFRDFTYPYPSKGVMPSQPHMIEEGDLMVSPTTGIILSTSHETTQKYLPGQGSPGIESPLKARIVRTAPRYEMLYVLIRSPAKMCLKTLSSIRELTTFCLSLDPLCSIKVLLTSADHVFEWVLSIAAKHSMSHEQGEGGGGTEGGSSSCLLLDDQTQWEVFLRKAGLNPFAAQVVLGTLKPGGDDELNALSRFVEMPSATRRGMFEGILGERVLKRVEKALEMDWQVDWAVDLP